MIVQLTFDQVANLWDVIKYAIEESLPPIASGGPDRMNNILSSLLDGRMQCWISYKKKEPNKFEGVVVTRIIKDDCSGVSSLLVYCLYGYEMVDRASWAEGYKALSKWGKSKKCSRIIGYADNEKVRRVASQLGGSTQYTFISIPIEVRDEDI